MSDERGGAGGGIREDGRGVEVRRGADDLFGGPGACEPELLGTGQVAPERRAVEPAVVDQLGDDDPERRRHAGIVAGRPDSAER